MRLDFAEPGNAGFDLVRHRRGRGDVAHRQRAADDARLRIGRAQHSGRHGADDAELVHRVRRHAGEIRQGAKAVENVGRQHRQFQRAEGVAGKLAERPLRHDRHLEAEQLCRIFDQHEVARSFVGCDLGDEIDEFAVIGHGLVVRMRPVGAPDDALRRMRGKIRANGTASA